MKYMPWYWAVTGGETINNGVGKPIWARSALIDASSIRPGRYCAGVPMPDENDSRSVGGRFRFSVSVSFVSHLK